MATLKIDLKDGNTGRWTKSGWEGVTRIAIVHGLSGTTSAMLQTAIDKIDVPKIGDEHPSLNNLFVETLSPESIGQTSVKLRIDYTPEPQTLDEPIPGSTVVGTTLSSAPFNTDFEGNVLKVTYTPAGGVEQSQGGIVEGLRPETTITTVRKEASSPALKSKQYVGKLNSGVFSLDLSAEPEEWMCTGIVGSSSDNGATWDVTYTFTYHDARGTLLEIPGWDAVVVWNDPSTGRPPGDWKDQAGSARRYQIYETIDFAGLNL